jgi:hypothetical protein
VPLVGRAVLFGQGCVQVCPVQDQGPVQQLLVQGAGQALADRVHPRCLHGGAHDGGPGGLEDGAGGRGEVLARRLTDQEGQRLQQIVRRGKHRSIRVRRAMIIMASTSGTLVVAIARLVAADEDTVRDAVHAFNAKGLAALDPQWTGGRPRLISD